MPGFFIGLGVIFLECLILIVSSPLTLSSKEDLAGSIAVFLSPIFIGIGINLAIKEIKKKIMPAGGRKGGNP
ncbi:MAG: hypothetical protein UY41_C0013G0047 [Candidatus Moranbacteria bacterium GW2011_GWE1_49_15]|nr:MAG: hypothetical protein UX75_C0011G0023 [Candidatus Moranbacteria bacterium GW2011_GWE2_47_10]KKW06881.1 MAG: hypothetical protein UY41_C0013G0047 [Candidatus Moranbacteria bacterium GW2011_GWE1_49_15]HBP01185.1 hypothetical protein [Candidatus Moranbacteria bacterium]